MNSTFITIYYHRNNIKLYVRKPRAKFARGFLTLFFAKSTFKWQLYVRLFYLPQKARLQVKPQSRKTFQKGRF